MKKFNLNDYILVKITEYGWSYLYGTVGRNYVINCIDPYEQIINGERYYKLQAHEVASLFGNATWATYPHPIDANILIP